MERAVILGAARTPFGRFGGALVTLGAAELGGAAIREAVDRSGVVMPPMIVSPASMKWTMRSES